MATYNKEKNTEYARRWREKNREKHRAQMRKQYHKHREKLLPKMKEYSRNRYRSDPRVSLFDGAKRRAKLYDLPLEITIDDIIIPDTCPVLGIPLTPGEPANTPTLPSLDRIVPEKGYVPGNIIVMSLRANSIKKNATLDEVRCLFEWMSTHPALV